MATDDGARVTESGVADGDVVQLVEDKSALEYGRMYLHVAAQEGVVEAVRVLVESAADGTLDAKDDDKDTALHWAAMKGHAGVVEDLVGVGTECDAGNSDGWTPLHDAARNGDAAVIRALECGGADVDAADTCGFRPLHIAAWDDRSAAWSALLECGAAVGVKAKRHNSSYFGYPYSEGNEIIMMVGAEV
jgi:ankyrin repeat protein